VNDSSRGGLGASPPERLGAKMAQLDEAGIVHLPWAAYNELLTSPMPCKKCGRVDRPAPFDPSPDGTTLETAEADFRNYVSGPGEVAHRAILQALRGVSSSPSEEPK